MTTADTFAIRGEMKDLFRVIMISLCCLVPLDLDVKMKAVALGALFLIVSLGCF